MSGQTRSVRFPTEFAYSKLQLCLHHPIPAELRHSNAKLCFFSGIPRLFIRFQICLKKRAVCPYKIKIESNSYVAQIAQNLNPKTKVSVLLINFLYSQLKLILVAWVHMLSRHQFYEMWPLNSVTKVLISLRQRLQVIEVGGNVRWGSSESHEPTGKTGQEPFNN